ncbi:MAG: recombinase family protein [Wolbachia endosymbiont of Tyrophagus putrescentiae]|nr:recombinase family protein [Wolbachia endosymbiont of Tyrophagus putrescentiae]MDN5248980.1 recombinase family protein [Alphaproteobacteria bacterium]
MLKQIRCAIYTRKSCEEGLNQAFNSLDAQRIAGESYIASRRLEGWKVIEKKYDDGGYSGGNLERPGLRELLEDIERGKIDLVIVYKIDRLSRSLLDFAKIADFFEKRGVTFVSVTESFNTADSVGRLMLNIILSFAQYERELASERIRDKIAASRKKGLWMGSRVPLGYDAIEKKLIVNEREAELVKQIFESFVEMKSMTNVAKELNEKGYRTKESKGEKGKEFKKATVRGILTNATYIGFVIHKGTLYKGKHEAIIDEELWNKAKENIRTREHIAAKREVVLLKGLMRCYECDAAMQPTYTKKKNREYRYYVCGKYLKGIECRGKDHTIAAGEIEQMIIEQMPLIMSNTELMEQAFKGKEDKEAVVLETLQKISQMWENIFPVEQQDIIHLLIKTIWFKENGFKIEIRGEGLKSLVEKYSDPIEAKGEDIEVFVEYKLKKCSGKSMILVAEGEIKEKRNDLLLKSLVRANLWQSQLDEGKYANIKEICLANKIACPKYVRSILQLNFLAPKIKEAILEGKQPAHIRLNNFMGTRMSILWEDQMKILHEIKSCNN